MGGCTHCPEAEVESVGEELCMHPVAPDLVGVYLMEESPPLGIGPLANYA